MNLRIENKKRSILFFTISALLIVVTFSAYKAVKWYLSVPKIERISLLEASKKGEKKTVQLLIQIAPGKSKGALERGDVVLSAPEDKQFSIAEKEGFLIIKMHLTETEQQLLMLPLNEKGGIFDSEKEKMNKKILERRKFSVDLEKIGIEKKQIEGKFIEGKIFEDDALIQKELE